MISQHFFYEMDKNNFNKLKIFNLKEINERGNCGFKQILVKILNVILIFVWLWLNFGNRKYFKIFIFIYFFFDISKLVYF